MGDPNRLRRALAALDAANADDPNTIEVRGEARPKELAHAALASEWISRLRPDAGEALVLAARAHHLRRWEIARSDYAAGLQGYHRWRRALQRHHAELAGEILSREGAQALLSELPDARLVEIADAGHHAQLDRPAETLAALRGFLCELE